MLVLVTWSTGIKFSLLQVLGTYTPLFFSSIFVESLNRGFFLFVFLVFSDLLSHAAYLSAFHLFNFCDYFLSPIVSDPFVLVCLYTFLDTVSWLGF